MPGFCNEHGPYDDANCPYCGGMPANPIGLGDEAPTDIGFDVGMGANYIPQQQQPYPGMGGGNWDSEAATDPGGDDFYEQEKQRRAGGAKVKLVEVEDATMLEYEPTGIMGILWVKSGPKRGNTYVIKDGTVVGRKDGSLLLDDPKVSNPHAKFTIEEEQFIVWDFGSKNGTLVNDKKIRGASELKENDEVKIGDTVFILKVLPE